VTQVVELSDRDLKKTMKKRMLEDLLVKVDNMHEQMGIFSRVMETTMEPNRNSRNENYNIRSEDWAYTWA